MTPPPHRIRPAAPDDVAFLADVSITAIRAQGRLPADFDEADWRGGFEEWSLESIDDPTTDLNVIELEGRRVGRLRITRTPESVELNGIQLHPNAQNRGIGTAIITELQSEAATRGVPLELHVERDNLDARRLYDRLGFTKTGEDGAEDVMRWDRGGLRFCDGEVGYWPDGGPGLTMRG